MSKIVISYRRTDSPGTVGRIFDRLEGHYGRESVFLDIDDIPLGTDFREHINRALQECEVLIAVVGVHWLGARDQGPSRIMDENDFVRIEIDTALKRGIPVIPVLIDGATMPEVSNLPESLKDFPFRNAAEVDVGRDFNHHIDRLIRTMDSLLANGKIASREPEPDLNAADGFKTILSRSKWAKELASNPDQLPPVQYEASMKSDAERIGARLKSELVGKLHDLLRLGNLTPWGRPEGHRPQRPIKPEEWDDIALVEERDLTSEPANICGWRRVSDVRGRRIAYVQVHFSSVQLYGQFPLTEERSGYDTRLRMPLREFWQEAEARRWNSSADGRMNFLDEIRQAAIDGELVLWGKQPTLTWHDEIARQTPFTKIASNYWHNHKIEYLSFLYRHHNRDVYSERDTDGDSHPSEKYFDLHVESHSGRAWLNRKAV